ncbi:MAG: hypothetical protein BJ554DRAFT_177 [Olpidium bornovanus]|uniref:Uncharacterized protein n=1 Tax=Olpidium bornovanus TaxID=278681 RepID=A0A8H7ZU93_9FUNG|nr:MAG: hypothetical protein BJ554DRAFT_177 [Olpidium bornovanus]
MLVTDTPRVKEYVIPAQPRKLLAERAAQLRSPTSVPSRQTPSPALTPVPPVGQHIRYSLRPEPNGINACLINGTARLTVTGSSLISAGSAASLEQARVPSYWAAPPERPAGDSSDRPQAVRAARAPRATAASYNYLFSGIPGSHHPAAPNAAASPGAADPHHQQPATAVMSERRSIAKPKRQAVAKVRYH